VETTITELGVPYIVQNETTGYGPPRADTIAVRHFRIQDTTSPRRSASGCIPPGR
jgi:hypothetical protein